mgnify:FL=1
MKIFPARHAGICHITNTRFEAGTEIVHTWQGYALASEMTEEARTKRAVETQVTNFFALYDSGRRELAARTYDAISPAARKMVDDEAQARSERACRV